jgi:hypothetical protein
MQGRGRFAGLFDHRGEHVDVADGDAFGEEGLDERHFGQVLAPQGLEGGGYGGPTVPEVVPGAELDGIHRAGA